MPRLRTWQLFALCVGVWGTTWYAITWQLDDLGPEFGVAVRFALAGAAVLGYAAWRGDRLRFPAATQAVLALQGAFLYGLAYVAIYHAERHVASALVAVGYSASPLLAGIGAALLFGAAVRGRFLLGGVLGVAGVALMFWAEIGAPARGRDGVLGALLTTAAVLLSTVGSLVASRNRSRGLPLLPVLGYGMLWGAAVAAIVAVAVGGRVGWPTSWQSAAALIWLAGGGSIVAFACFLTLQDRIGVGPAGSVGVMTPLLALVVSVAFEGYRLDAVAGAGVVVAVLGNALMLWPAAKPAAGLTADAGAAVPDGAAAAAPVKPAAAAVE